MPNGATAVDAELSTAGVDIDENGHDGPDTIDEIEEIDDLADLEDLEDIDEGDDALDDEDALDDDGTLDADVDVDDEVGVVEVPVAVVGKAATPADPTAEPETDDEELLADEVEASLDVILAERLRGGETEVDEEVEEDEEEDDAPNQLATVIPVRQPDEFLCQSCFLLKPPGQLADPAHQLCRDCA